MTAFAVTLLILATYGAVFSGVYLVANLVELHRRRGPQ